MRRAIEIAWPLAILLVFVATFRRGPVDRDSPPAAAASCVTTGESARPRSIGDLESCVALDASDVEAMLALASAYEAAQRADDAERTVRRALTIEPHDARAHVALGRLLLARGDRDGARAEGESALGWHVGSAAALRLVAEARAR